MIDLPANSGLDDPLAQPTRRRLFALLTGLSNGATTAELADHLGLHPNGVRTHLERLERAALIARARSRQPRGRPIDVWTIASGAHPAGEPPSAYEDLARWLAQALRRRQAGGLRSIETTGRQIGRELPTAGSDAPNGLENALAALGFAPAAPQRDGDRITFRLRNCPYRAAVHQNQPAVCALHKGITQGLLDVLDPHARLARFVARDPDQAGCEIALANAGDRRRS